MRLGRMEGIVGEEDGYSAESDAASCCRVSTSRTRSTNNDGRAARRDRSCACCSRRRSRPSGGPLLLDEPTNHLDLDSIHWLRAVPGALRGHADRDLARSALPQRVCTHIADIDYETIITYTGGYDDMVMAKTQIRSRIESENAQREKKIAQLQDFIARFGAGRARRRPRRAARKWSGCRPPSWHGRTSSARTIRFTLNRPSGRLVAEFDGLSKAYGEAAVIGSFTAVVNRGEKIVLVGCNGAGKTTLLKAPCRLAEPDPRRPIGRGVAAVGPRGADRLLPEGSHRADRTRSTRRGMAAPVRSRRRAPGHPRPAGPDALQRRGRPQANRGGCREVRRRDCSLPHHAAEAERAGVRRAHQPSGLQSINALNIALQKFEGTVLLVTHDQDLLEEVGTRVRPGTSRAAAWRTSTGRGSPGSLGEG